MRVAISLGFALALACIPELEVIEGEHLRFEYAPTLTPCAGNARALDALVPVLQEQLVRPELPPLRYTWHDGDPRHYRISAVERVTDACGSGGCVLGSHAVAVRPFYTHELIHLIMQGESKPFFSEGIAVAMGPLSGFADTEEELTGPRYLPGIPPDPRITMAANRADDVDYASAGAFVAFLLVRHGADKFSRFYDHLSVADTLGRIRQAFRGVYGVELDDEVELYMAGAPCPDRPFPMIPIECQGPLVPWAGDVWSHGVILSCDDESVAGGIDRHGNGLARRPLTLDVETSGEYVIELHADRGVSLRFGPCFGCPWDGADVVLDGGRTTIQEFLPAGRYYALMFADVQSAPRVGITVRSAE